MASPRTRVLASLVFAFAWGCQSRGTSTRMHPTQGAVSSAVQHLQRTIAAGNDTRSPATATTPSDTQPPAFHVAGAGVGAHLEIQQDRAHEAANGIHTPAGWAMTWSNAEHTRAMFARADENGAPVGAPVVVRESRSDQEDVAGPTVAFTGSEYGMVWVDPANGRVRFVRLGTGGQRIGHSTIVHDGLSMPIGTRVVWTGSEFGVAVALDRGVYFARVSRGGDRVGDGTIVSEGTAIAALDDLSYSASGFAVSWHDAGEGATHHEAHLTPDGQLLRGGASHGSGPMRVATR